jgi:N-acetylglutamate synthase-like GNAT family acetyltransferase
MDTRRATQRDLEPIRSLLEESGLSTLPSRISLSNLIVALEGAETIGAIAIEIRALSGLLQTVVVSPDHRRKGVGASLVRSIIARGHELGLRDLYLLREDAPEFFSAVGFVPIERSELPGEIRAMRSYKDECPASTRLMKLPLATRW